MSAASRHGGLPDDMDELDVWLEEHVDLADRCRAMCPRPDGSFWVCSFSAGHDGSHSWTDKPTEFWGGDPDEVRPSDSLAESQAGLSGPSGSPTSPPQRAYAASMGGPLPTGGGETEAASSMPATACDCGLLRESLVLCAEIAGADGEAVEAALSGAMTYPSVAQFAVDSVRQLRAD